MFWIFTIAAGILVFFREKVSAILSKLPLFKYKHVDNLEGVTDKFLKDFKQSDKDDDNKRRDKYTSTTETFYNLITDFYEYGWGQSFHFAPKWKSETFEQSILRYEHYFSSVLGLKPGMKVLDVGCGIGGPMRAIAKFSRADITGVNITKEHIERAKRYNARDGVDKMCNINFIQADFNKIPVADGSFDAIYDFEATLHSTHRPTTFKELYRVLKPGGKMISAQYCLLKDYDEKNEEHKAIIRKVDNTNGCYCAGQTVALTDKAFKDAGFKILDSFDAFDVQGDTPFHEVFVSKQGGDFLATPLGRKITLAFVTIGEKLRLMPKGTIEVQQMLIGAADSFADAGKRKLLTPGYVYILEKPGSGSSEKKE